MTAVEQLKEITGKSGLIYDLCNEVINDERFPIWSGSSKPNLHHYGKGGLAQHTLEVTQFCQIISDETHDKHNDIFPYQLICAAVFHDSGKMWDYAPKDDTYTEWTSREHKYKIHHISRSAFVWRDAAKKHRMSDDFTDSVTHAILSHHGMREWGSPVSPRTRNAWILHLCDQMSARLNDCYLIGHK